MASPFKPIDYMDKMDIFGYRYIPGYPTISRYLVIEIKRDVAQDDVMGQIMKYVDWINSEYAHNNYSMIEAYIVAADFSEEAVAARNEICQRTYLSVKLIKYEFTDNELLLTEIDK